MDALFHSVPFNVIPAPAEVGFNVVPKYLEKDCTPEFSNRFATPVLPTLGKTAVAVISSVDELVAPRREILHPDGDVATL